MVRPQALNDPPTAASPAASANPDQAAPPPGGEPCPTCGALLASDQEWCVECGTARTAIQPPPDWRIGVAIILAVIAVVALVLVIVWP